MAETGKLSIQILSIWLIFAYLVHGKGIYGQTDSYAKADIMRLRDIFKCPLQGTDFVDFPAVLDCHP